MSMIALREHQVKMQHFGSGTFHAEDGTTAECLPVTEHDTVDELRAEEDEHDQQANLGAIEGDAVQALSNLPQSAALGLAQSASFQTPLSPQVPEHTTSEMRLVSLMQASSAPMHPHNDPSFLAIDPAMQSQTTAQAASALETLSESLGAISDRNAMVARYRELQREMDALKSMIGPS